MRYRLAAAAAAGAVSLACYPPGAVAAVSPPGAAGGTAAARTVRLGAAVRIGTAAGPAAAAGRAATPASIGCMGAPPPAGTVSCTPAPGTPQLAPSQGGQVEQVRQLVRCGSMMYAVGTFSSISAGSAGPTYSRNNAFSFLATPPYTVSKWNPDVNGEVNSIAVGGPRCSRIYLGGSFSRVHGARARDLAEVSPATGAVQAKFRHDADNTVETLLLHDNRVLAGGFFTAINGSPRKYYVSLNYKSGVDDGYLRLRISGQYQYQGVGENHTRIYNQQLSPSGKLLLAEGDFTRVGGKQRQQIFMLSLGRSRGVVTGWTSGEFAGHCVANEPFYVRAASWAPDGRTIYVADTGYHPLGGPIGMTPRSGLCDAAAAFPASQKRVSRLWINYTGCDSLYSTAAGAAAVYFGGHERWADNNDGCDAAGPGAISALGMVGLSPADGSVIFDPTRGRGLGADDMLVTSAGLWIASDNAPGGGSCGGHQGYWGICLLPNG
jgi:hypothetical protein